MTVIVTVRLTLISQCNVFDNGQECYHNRHETLYYKIGFQFACDASTNMKAVSATRDVMDTCLYIIKVNTRHVCTGSASSGCNQHNSITPGIVHKLHIDVDDPNFGIIRRSYRILLPVAYSPDYPHKLLFDFHGLTMNSDEEVHGSNIIMLSELGVIIVWPNGSNDSKSKIRCWNAVGCDHDTGGPKGDTCDRNRTKWGEYEVYESCVQLHGNYSASNTCYCSSCWNDVLFIETLLKDLESKLCIDLSHIHATGISAGGMQM